MKTEELKTGFWGFKKYSVYQYITGLEEQFSAKLLEKDAEDRALLERERERVRELESELASLRRRQEEHSAEQQLISGALVEAQRHAEALRSQSEAKEQQARRELMDEAEQRRRELERYDLRLQQLREQLRSMLREMDQSAEKLREDLGLTLQQLPEQNLSLFHRRAEPGSD